MAIGAVGLPSIIETGEMVQDMAVYAFLSNYSIAYLIMKFNDFILSSSIDSGGIKEGGVGISLGDPGDSRLGSPKVFLTFENSFIFIREVIFKILKEEASMVVTRLLDYIKSSNNLLFFKDISKDIVVSVRGLIMEVLYRLLEGI